MTTKMKQHYKTIAAAFTPATLLFNGEALGPVADYYFDPPSAIRADAIVGTLLEEEPVNMDKTQWRTPRNFVSVAEDAELFMNDARIIRPQHTKLVSNSFAVHGIYGPGHVLRTDGRVAAFWTGETCYIVHFTNLKFVAVTVSRKNEPKAGNPPRMAQSAKVKAALLED